MSGWAQCLAFVLVLDVGDSPQHLLEIVDCCGFLVGQGCFGMKMIKQRDEGVAYPAQLLAIACHVRSTSASTSGSLD